MLYFPATSLRVSASLDTQQRLPYNRNAPKKPPKNPNSLSPSPSHSSVNATLSAPASKILSDLLKRSNPTVTEAKLVESENLYLGYEQWLPNPPKVQKPRSVFNAASLAYIGDCIYELYARRHFLFPPLNIEEYNDRVTAVVRCEAQDLLLQKLLGDNYLTVAERDILRWGKNVGSSKTRTKKRAGAAVYNRASSLETLIGYLYLNNVKRLDEIMERLGFSTDSTLQLISEESNSDEPNNLGHENESRQSS